MLRTVTAEPRRIRSVLPAMAASTTSGADTEKSGAMMLANAERVDADLVGQHAFSNDIAQRLGLRHRTPVAVDHHVAECIQTQFNHQFSKTRVRVERIPRDGKSRSGKLSAERSYDVSSTMCYRGGVDGSCHVSRPLRAVKPGRA